MTSNDSEPFDDGVSESAGEVRVLDPERVKLFRSETGVPRMTLEGELTTLVLSVKCSFPLSRANEYVSLRDGDNHEIGLVENLHDLDRDSRRIAEEEIERRYFLPEITVIYSVKGHFGTYDWEVETDRGRRSFHMRGRSENIIRSGPRRILISDVLGNRYKISDRSKLDRRSKVQLLKVV